MRFVSNSEGGIGQSPREYKRRCRKERKIPSSEAQSRTEPESEPTPRELISGLQEMVGGSICPEDQTLVFSRETAYVGFVMRGGKPT